MFEKYKDKYINGQSAARSLGNIVKYEMTIVQRLSKSSNNITELSRVHYKRLIVEVVGINLID